jgi:multicomponent Na+:H+ antiporter subunit A
MNATWVLLIVALMAAPVVALVGALRPAWATPTAIAMTALSFLAALWGWRDPGTPIDRPWAETWGLRLQFELDGLANLYSLLATGIGLGVVLYASRYIPLHLHHEHRPDRDIVRFYAFLLLFMGAMVGLVMAQDTMLIFVFWDLTAVASYFLIGYDNQRADSRTSAIMALLVTGISAIAFLIGALILSSEYATFSLQRLFTVAEPSTTVTIAAGLMAISALAKSAQVPLHFWLPRAMAAPTPVSAYLHSAAMVAAGVFLIGRVYPLIALSQRLLDMLLIIGLLSMAVGGVLALSRDNLKQLLAYSTISQYGYVVVMFGLGGRYGIVGSAFYVIAHGLAKSALFLTAGSVTEATGQKDLSKVGGLWRQMPLLAAGSGMAAAALAALPLTIGFFKDELFFAAATNRGTLMQVLAVIGAALTFAYMGRFWLGIFVGEAKVTAKPIPLLMVVPTAVLGAVTIVGGVWPQPFVRVAERAGSVSLRTTAEVEVAYHIATTPENMMAIAAYIIGLVIILSRSLWRPLAEKISEVGAAIGPERIYRATLTGLNSFSDRIHWIEVRDLRSRVATVLVPAAVLIGATLLFTDLDDVFYVGEFARADIPLALMLFVVALAAITSAVPRDHFSMALALAGAGFGLAVVYSLLHAPDVALVAVLIETIFGLLLFGFLALLPRDVDHAEVVPSDAPVHTLPEGPDHGHRVRDSILALFATAGAFIVAWGILSRPAPLESVIAEHIRLTPDAHGGAIVTVILADFRGFDTMGEVTVVGIALLGIATLLRRRLSQ